LILQHKAIKESHIIILRLLTSNQHILLQKICQITQN